MDVDIAKTSAVSKGFLFDFSVRAVHLWKCNCIPCRSDCTCTAPDCGETFEGDKRPNGDTVVSEERGW